MLIIGYNLKSYENEMKCTSLILDRASTILTILPINVFYVSIYIYSYYK